MTRTETEDRMTHIQWRPAWRAGTRLAVIAAVTGAGLAACSGGEKRAADGDPMVSAATAGTAAAPAAADSPAVAETMAAAQPGQTPNGARIFVRCSTCHQMNGEGLPGSFPPLKGSRFANAANPAAPIRIVLHGLQGLITVEGKRFNSAMPPYGTNQPLSDAEVAAVLTYVRSSWGNHASAVTPEAVAHERAATASRKTPWGVSEIEALLNSGSH
jgi:mono/diheme cytochrome c family protein